MTTPIALTIAGSDSGGGAGIQADLKTFSALGVYGASVVTALTAQNTLGVGMVEPASPAMIRAQMSAVLGDLDVRAIKLGMLGDAEAIDAVAAELPDDMPVVLDPVMIAKSGDALLRPSAIRSLRDRLMTRADLLTPNIPEAACLLGARDATSEDGMIEQGRALLELGARAVLMKGGHLAGDICPDLLITPGGVLRLSAPRRATRNTHGTGCTLSAAIAAGLAQGKGMAEAVRAAHGYLQGAIAAADGLGVGGGHGPVHHFHAAWHG
ncbi:bifunctional hydroxymethylpyrimidine kinase/phosphomethylpyrimidine kinase [Paracoccus sp. PARArs4]|uniref:bifunctional hydroxymethylpyrimidine kinase/phosphomethylpyrimidine kinase n=1 Tax=Paracoccus sp. PARArs4 TaxID=2853442 RepID=UPI0024A790B6|nr:bifunctional hydroxymethylpyrimidine kinase/phosphomethylpyrimidine kinase [Paracoccus sp. PARArs4]